MSIIMVLWVGLKEKGRFQFTKPCRGNCNVAVQTFVYLMGVQLSPLRISKNSKSGVPFRIFFTGLALVAKDIIVFRFIIEY